MEYFYDGLDSSGRPYTVKASMTSNPLKLKSSKLVTRAEGVNSWHTNEEDHNGYTGTNSRTMYIRLRIHHQIHIVKQY